MKRTEPGVGLGLESVAIPTESVTLSLTNLARKRTLELDRLVQYAKVEAHDRFNII